MSTNPNSGRPRKFSIQFTVGTLFLFATAITASVAIGLQYYFGKQQAEAHVLSKLTNGSSQVSEYLQQVELNATSSVKILQGISTYTDHEFTEVETQKIFAQILKDNPLFYSLYFGRADEDFFQIINLDSSPIVRKKINASEKDRWVVIKIYGEGEQRVRTTRYLTESFGLTKNIIEPSNYFPSQRPWFVGAMEDDVYKTDPYLFQHLKITGQTYSIQSKYGAIGIDIVLSAVNEKMTASELGLSENTDVESYVFNDKGEVNASNIKLYNDVLIPSSTALDLTAEQKKTIADAGSLMVSNQNDWGPYDYAQAGQPKGYAIDVLDLIVQQTGIELEYINGFDSVDLAKMYHVGELDVLHSVPERGALGVESQPMFTGQLAVATKQLESKPTQLNQLVQGQIAVVGGYGLKSWLLEREPALNIIEIENLDNAKQALLSGSVDYLLDTYHTLSELNELEARSSVAVFRLASAEPISFHLYMQNENADVVSIINQAINAITPEQRLALKSKWLDTNQWRGTFVPHPELFHLSQQPELHQQMTKLHLEGQNKFVYMTKLASHHLGEEYFAVVIPERAILAQIIPRLLKSIAATVFVMICLFPLAWRFGTPIVVPVRALRRETQKIKARQFDQVELIDTRIKEVSELSVSIAEMSTEIQQYEKQQEAFVESFIKLIAQAIDDKSPYTAGHCNRVPELGLLLAKAAEEAQTGPFKSFSFANDDERREFRIAAWLHDCGKITTPEHIVDKGSKLEANYNRIHEIRMRFEVLLRDAEIHYLQAIHNGADQNTALAALNETKQTLQGDYEFVAKANVGGEFMAEDKIARIQQIATQTWLRHFDDRLGLSPAEELAKPESNRTLPIEEHLLADKQEHIVHRLRPLEFEPQHGIKMKVPELEQNLGEVYNLSISRGTLTDEDRFKINEHMISGIKMLEALPFPPELSRVPRYASTHHETLKGTGYPRKLSADELSTPERILVIADIFEALTASDRPYKKAKPISVAIDILHKMALDEHVDMELFKLFLESGAYLEYAHSYLPAAQIDEVNIDKYLGLSAMN